MAGLRKAVAREDRIRQVMIAAQRAWHRKPGSPAQAAFWARLDERKARAFFEDCAAKEVALRAAQRKRVSSNLERTLANMWWTEWKALPTGK
ncbi:MAG: hypothetical protein J4203_03825 [Candidatus Diapherotrites archaeon]|uniref:Uncharacterized protein n=1 Tax=Candidatus Iainarchaeum sp. TaxID=3101447 RepID=A0A8T4LJB8_9ARCH|nr:hypothetical protein [Candidatus Diapherotrites archaeon]